MKDTFARYFSVSALIVALIALGLVYFAPPKFGASAGTEHYNQENFYGGYTVGSVNYTAISARNCATATWNPAAVGSTTVATLDLFVSGYAAGDILQASISTGTQGLAVIAVGTTTTTGTTTIVLFDPDNTSAAVDIATTTAKVCYVH